MTTNNKGRPTIDIQNVWYHLLKYSCLCFEVKFTPSSLVLTALENLGCIENDGMILLVCTKSTKAI